MREIKFRAWDKAIKKIINNINLLNIDFGIFFYGNIDEYIELVECKIMQYTGLKDKNGKEIYEGDIIKAIDYSPQNYQIKFIEGGFCATNKNLIPIDINHFYPSTGCIVEIIGNIYENPELLESK